MQRGNLSTRPFYNERLVHVALASAALLVVGATAFNAQRLVLLTARERTLAGQISSADAEAQTLQQGAQGVRSGVNPEELERVAARATEANVLIDQRRFSWTALFNHLEAAIPDDVMLEAVQPSIDKGITTVTLIVVGRSVAAIDAFMERLEDTGAFDGVLSREEQVTDAGTYRATLDGQYWPERTKAAAEAPREGAPVAPLEGAAPRQEEAR